MKKILETKSQAYNNDQKKKKKKKKDGWEKFSSPDRTHQLINPALFGSSHKLEMV
jgi:hypothetical protein